MRTIFLALASLVFSLSSAFACGEGSFVLEGLVSQQLYVNLQMPLGNAAGDASWNDYCQYLLQEQCPGLALVCKTTGYGASPAGYNIVGGTLKETARVTDAARFRYLSCDYTCDKAVGINYFPIPLHSTVDVF